MEKQTDKLKCSLARQHDFNLFETFKMFDTEEKGYINQEEFIHQLLAHTQKQYNRVLKEQASLIFNRYNVNEDRMLTYTEFCQLFIPHSDIQLQDELIQRRPFAQMSQETADIL